jgi:hypothetical protein
MSCGTRPISGHSTVRKACASSSVSAGRRKRCLPHFLRHGWHRAVRAFLCQSLLHKVRPVVFPDTLCDKKQDIATNTGHVRALVCSKAVDEQHRQCREGTTARALRQRMPRSTRYRRCVAKLSQTLFKLRRPHGVGRSTPRAPRPTSGLCFGRRVALYNTVSKCVLWACWTTHEGIPWRVPERRAGRVALCGRQGS